MTRTRPFQSASFRLVAVFTLIVVAVSVLALLVQFQAARRAMEAQHLATLKADMDGFATLYEQRRIVALRQAIDLRSQGGRRDIVLLLQDRDGATLAGNLAAWPAGLVAVPGLFAVEDVIVLDVPQRGRFDVVAHELPGGFRVLAGRSRALVDTLIQQYQRRIWALAFGLLVVSLMVGLVFVRSVLQRVDRVNALADRVAGGDMLARLPPSRRQDEFSALDRHINGMLDRVSTLHRAVLRVSDCDCP